jgi:uncharacterized membrane protein
MIRSFIRLFHVVMCNDSARTTIILGSTQQLYQRTKSILTYQLSFIGKGVATCFDLHRVIIRQIYRNVILVIELFFLIWIYIIKIFYNLFR